LTMFARRSALFGFTSRLLDLILTALAFPIGYWIRKHILTQLPSSWLARPEIYPFRNYWLVFLSTLAIWFTVGYGLGIYRDMELRTRRQLGWDVIKLVGVSLLLLNAGLYLFHAPQISRSLVLTIGAIDLFVLLASRELSLHGRAWLRNEMGCRHYCLIVGTGNAARDLAALIEESEVLGLQLVGFVHLAPDAPISPPGLRQQYSVFSLDEVPGILQNQVVDEVLFAVSKEQLEPLEPLIVRCHEERIRTRVDLGFLPRTFSHVHVENLGHIPLLSLGAAPHDEFLLFAKRVIDVVVSAVALVLFSPLLLLVALLVRLTSPGPVIYKQIRCGLNGRRFTFYKFRSMIANADALRPHIEWLNELDGAAFKISEDPRCTPLGRWLRKFSLDELPQFWNVLRGDMSLVGPRPPLPEEVEKYETWHRCRLRMRPGLTCLWATEGRNRLSFDQWMKSDLLYIDNWSLWLDTKIFVKSIPHVVLGRGAS
jgi:exopolysaccharide biosynthesis polyprenyl glycosylphosphotransferase